jgi:peptidoglycan hydrolase CwlO-like protein
MTIPRWLFVPFVTLALGASADRLNVERRLTTVEASYKDIQNRLDRIESKVDQLVQRGDEVNAR